MTLRLSVAIITKNEERNLPRCLESVRGLADEVVVVDSGSTDRTRELAEALGARVTVHPFDDFGSQKNRAVDMAAGAWVLNLDADEWLSDALREEIRHAIAAPPADCAGWEFPRHNRICGRWGRFAGWRERRKFRLWRRGAVRWEGRVHEWGQVRDGSAIHRLHAPLLHDLGDDWGAYRAQQLKYAGLQAVAMRARGRTGSTVAAAGHAAWAFVRAALLQGGVLEGWFGLRTAALRGQYAWTKWRALAALPVLWLALAAWAGDGAVTVVVNPSMPANLLPGTEELLPAQWRRNAAGVGIAPEVTTLAEPGPLAGAAVHRVRVAHAAGPVRGSSYSLLQAAVFVEPGEPFTLSGWFRAAPGTAIAVRHVAGAAYTPLTGFGDWQRFEITERAASGTGYVQIGMNLPATPGVFSSDAATVDLCGLTLAPGRDARAYQPSGIDDPRYTAMALCAPGEVRHTSRLFEHTDLDQLPEDGATNLLRWSDQPWRAPWRTIGLDPGTGVTTGIRSPIGTSKGAQLIELRETGIHGLTQPVDVEDGVDYCASMFVSLSNRTACRLAIRWPGGTVSWGSFDVAKGSAVLGNGSPVIRTIGQGWFRIAVHGTAPASGEAQFELLTLPAADADTAHPGNPALRLVVWGAQFERGRRPTSYIPTFFLPDTRAADPGFTGPSPESSAR